jgi:hypothetical protein
MDTSHPLYETMRVVRSGTLRTQLAGTLRTAYADGLLSEGTFSYRLELLLSSRVIEPARLIGDLTLRSRTRRRRAVGAGAAALRRAALAIAGRVVEPPVVLGLDWDGAHDQLLVGRHPSCDVILPGATVSRYHARLTFRDGHWILRDLESTNGTRVNGASVGRCEVLPGDQIRIGEHELLID